MPAEDIQSWSTTAASNATADTGINWAEGQPRASVNNSARSMMAAHAKDRNLKNGSITTGGTANAQTFLSGVSYTSVPSGLTVRLKVGVTNTGATTLNMDGIGAVAVKDRYGNDLGAGALAVGQYAEFIYNGTNWILLSQTSAGAAPQCGRLDWVSTTALAFKPHNGDQIKINGLIYSIPAAGITGLGTTGVFVSGVAAQNLVATGRYLVYAFNNSGVITADFWPQSGAGLHSKSATAGNVGTEIRTGDDTRTLIGLCQLSGSTQFVNTNSQIFTVSWFNRRNIALQGASTGGATTAASALAEITNVARAEFLSWANPEEQMFFTLAGSGFNNSGSAGVAGGIFLDGAAVGMNSLAQCFVANAFVPCAAEAGVGLAEGYHVVSPAGYAYAGGNATFYVSVGGVVRG